MGSVEGNSRTRQDLCQEQRIRNVNAGDLSWIRPVRIAGLIMTLPDGRYIEQAEEIVLTPLGELLMQAKQKR